MNKGRIIKGVGGLFTVMANNTTYTLKARGKLKEEGELSVGDFVAFNDDVIEERLPRKNSLIRPFISNLDQIVLVLSSLPQPDFNLVDKIIAKTIEDKVNIVLCVNKKDIISKEFEDNIINQYKNAVTNIIFTSCFEKHGLDNLKEVLKGKLSVLAGQSAVGKSSLINLLIDKEHMTIGELSYKTKRGKHTTRHAELFSLGEDTYVVDTPGFSMFELSGFDPYKFHEYYTDFDIYRDKCRFGGNCTHINEPDCAVKKAVEEGKISKERYKRYLEIYNEIKIQFDRRYS